MNEMKTELKTRNNPFAKFGKTFKHKLHLLDEQGATMPEYAIIGIVVVLAGVLAFTDLGRSIADKVNQFLAGF